MMNSKMIGGLLGLGAVYLLIRSMDDSAGSLVNVYVDPGSGMATPYYPTFDDGVNGTVITGGGSSGNSGTGGAGFSPESYFDDGFGGTTFNYSPDTEISFYDPTNSLVNLIREQFEPDIDSGDTTTMDNRQAFLRTIQDTEGTSQYENPYAVIFGGIELDPVDYTDHPGNLDFKGWTYFNAGGKRTYSTAAGAYQFLQGTWNRLKQKLNLPDFSPQSQDMAALELIREKGALADIDNGDIVKATDKVRKIWASLPGANYPGQTSKTMDYVVSRFNNYRNA